MTPFEIGLLIAIFIFGNVTGVVATLSLPWLSFNKQPAEREGIVNKTLFTHVERALTYQAQIGQAVDSRPENRKNDHLQAVTQQIKQWTTAIRELAQRIDRFEQDKLIHEDLTTVPQAIEQLQNKLIAEVSDTTRLKLEQALVSRQEQLAFLTQLQETMEQAKIEIDRTLAALGTIYSQLLIGQSANHAADYAKVASRVDEQVRQLREYLEALQEVRLSSSR